MFSNRNFFITLIRINVYGGGKLYNFASAKTKNIRRFGRKNPKQVCFTDAMKLFRPRQILLWIFLVYTATPSFCRMT